MKCVVSLQVDSSHACGSVIISANLLLSSGRCVYYLKYSQMKYKLALSAVFGNIKISKGHRCEIQDLIYHSKYRKQVQGSHVPTNNNYDFGIVLVSLFFITYWTQRHWASLERLKDIFELDCKILLSFECLMLKISLYDMEYRQNIKNLTLKSTKHLRTSNVLNSTKNQQICTFKLKKNVILSSYIIQHYIYMFLYELICKNLWYKN